MIPRGNSVLAGVKYRKDERAEIISALKRLAIAQALFWDALRAVETREGNLEIETTGDLAGMLAGNYNNPPGDSDIPDRLIWKSFLENAEVKRYESVSHGTK